MILPIIMMVLFATIEFGWMFHVRGQLQNAARAGARAAIVKGATNADVTAAVNAALAANDFSTHTTTIAIKRGDTDAAASVASLPAGTPVLVQVTAPWSQYSVLTVDVAGFWTDDVEGSAVMRREGD
jgi:Flp pilus assembly protein TadG